MLTVSINQNPASAAVELAQAAQPPSAVWFWISLCVCVWEGGHRSRCVCALLSFVAALSMSSLQWVPSQREQCSSWRAACC